MNRHDRKTPSPELIELREKMMVARKAVFEAPALTEKLLREACSTRDDYMRLSRTSKGWVKDRGRSQERH